MIERISLQSNKTRFKVNRIGVIFRSEYHAKDFVYLIDGFQKISVEQEEQYYCESHTANACKLHGKTKFAFAFFTKSNGQTKTQTAE